MSIDRITCIFTLSYFHLFSASSMAQTYEYPPALIQHRLLGFERLDRAPPTFRLCHHYFLTRLKLALRKIYREKPTEYLREGRNHEMVAQFFFFLSFLTHIAVQFSLHPWHLLCPCSQCSMPLFRPRTS